MELGWHIGEILEKVGFSSQDIKRFREEGLSDRLAITPDNNAGFHGEPGRCLADGSGESCP